jgi:hypothetical protein
MIEPSIIFSALTNSPDVTALVQQKIFPVTAAQATAFPYITYEVVSETPDRCRTGIANTAMRLQVNVFALSYKQLSAIYRAVRNVLDARLSDAINSEFLNQNDLYREEGDAYGKAIDFELINLKD